MQATNEIRNILAKGQAKAGANPLAVLDGIMSGDALEAVVGGIGMGDSSAAYAKMAKLRTETRVVELGRSGNEAYDRLRNAAAQILSLIHISFPARFTSDTSYAEPSPRTRASRTGSETESLSLRRLNWPRI